MQNIGFMQGRLSPIIDNKIQSFPFNDWEEEFSKATKIGLSCIEWTLDYPNLDINPLLQERYRNKILELSQKNDINIPSVTLDCCMQRPFWKEKNALSFNNLIRDLEKIIFSAKSVGAKIVVIPLVDNGSIQNESEFNILKKTINSMHKLLRLNAIRVAFESDYPPLKLKSFIQQFNDEFVGINYDTGNSAALGYDPVEEILTYGERIINVHIKDRVLNGTTVRLGTGNTDFKKVFRNLLLKNYKGNFILQTARSQNNKHIEELELNINFLKNNFPKIFK